MTARFTAMGREVLRSQRGGAWMAGLAPLVRLNNPVRDYAWGSRTAIAELQARPAPTAAPEAELWIGAHPTSPSRLPDGRPLDAVIATDPDRWLGSDAVATHGPALPFLLKVLAVDRSLSLQAHPTAEQAATGFAREEAAGIPLDARHRTYRDRNPKPELLCALTPFHALCGFRPVDATLELLDALAVHGLEPHRDLLRRQGAAALPEVVRGLLRLGPSDAGRLVQGLRQAAVTARDTASGGALDDLARLVVDLSVRYPQDPGVVVAALLNRVTLAPGEALYLPAGVIHAYLRGVGVEIMASSDNVLRGGLTSKHVDVTELLDILHLEPTEVVPVEPQGTPPGPVSYPTPTDHFSLTRLDLDGTAVVELAEPTIRVILCVAGSLDVTADGTRVTVTSGQAVAAPAATAGVHLAGRGQAFLAAPGGC